MLARFLADVVVLVHLAFVLFVLFGGMLVARWPIAAWVHLPCAAYGAAIEIGQWICPLTPLENELRRRGGEAGYGGGFVEHYVLPVLYPSPLPADAMWVLAGILVSLNVIIYCTVLLRKHRRAPPRRGG
jgi:hypothetical protein